MSTALYKIILGLRIPYYCSCKTIKSTQDIQAPPQSDTFICFLSTHNVVDFCCCGSSSSSSGGGWWVMVVVVVVVAVVVVMVVVVAVSVVILVVVVVVVVVVAVVRLLVSVLFYRHQPGF